MKKTISVLLLMLSCLAAGCGGGGGGGESFSASSDVQNEKSDAEAVAADAALLDFEAIRGSNAGPALVIADLVLPAVGANGTFIAWSSSPSVVAGDGRVSRPPFGAGDAAVTLTATVRRGEASAEKSFALTVLALPEGVTFTYPGSGVGIDHPPIATDLGPASLTYRIDLGATPRDVYFVFTNPSTVAAASSPAVTPLSADRQEELEKAQDETEALARWARTNGVGISGAPDIELFNADPWTYGGIDRAWRAGRAPLRAAPLAVDTVGKKGSFYDAWGSSIPATCRKVTAADGRTLNLWVADDSWAGGGCTRARCVTQAMVDALSDRLLRPGGDNDILEGVTAVFGAEWGNHPYGNMISPDNTLTVFIHDIKGDNSPSGGILGYFYARDNFFRSAEPTSNERLLLALDSVMLANPGGATWEITDPWPQEFLSTLGHELQHMVYFYQKAVKRQVPFVETWLNEMCSLVAEDLLATRLGVAGPRGVSSLDGTAGPPGNAGGRLGRFNYYDYLPVASAFTGSVSDPGEANLLNSYAVTYAFGAYLARNYGGAGFFRNLVQNSFGDFRAVDTALSYGGFGEDFATVLQKWGAAVILSDRAGDAAPAGYRYNAGGFFDSTIDGAAYRLGSINLFNYRHNGLSGPRIFDALPPSGEAGRHPTSNFIYRAGTGLTGTFSREVALPRGTRLTVVVK